MTSSAPRADATTWPFWAPSEAESVEAALDLAGVVAGDRLIDLGCGDGQVLLAAAERGAVVSGVEADPELADEARANLADAGIEADIRAGDLFDPALDLDADVFFTYLAPATLQRLLPRLQTYRSARLVTVDFDVPGLIPTKRSGSARLYVLPGRRRAAGRPGWPCTGTLVATVPDHQSLSCLELVHPGGDTTVRLSRSLQAVAAVFPGAVHLESPAHLAVDLRWEPMATGSVTGGVIRVDGVDEHGLFVITTDDDEGMWELTADAVVNLRRALRRTHPPEKLAQLLAAAG